MRPISYLLLIACFLAARSDIDFQNDPCPVVLGCKCSNYSLLAVDCANIDNIVVAELKKFYPNVEVLRIERWKEYSVDLNIFEPFKRLKRLQLSDSSIESLHLNTTLRNVNSLDLSRNELFDFDQVNQLFKYLPALRSLNVSRNSLKSVDVSTDASKSLAVVDLSENKMASVVSIPTSVLHLNLSRNELEHILNISTLNIASLDASGNQIREWVNNTWPRLVTLDVSGLKIQNNFSINAPNLRSLTLKDNSIVYLDFNQIRTPTLKNFDAARSTELEQVTGSLMPSVATFILSKTNLGYLPARFFENSKKLALLQLESTNIDCETCSLEWIAPVLDKLPQILTQCNKTRSDIVARNCSLNVINNGTIKYGLYEQNTYLGCQFVGGGHESPVVSWWRYRPAEYLGKYDPVTDTVDLTNTTHNGDRYELLKGGVLMIKNSTRKEIERYVCVGELNGQTIHGIIKFRLDYSSWYTFNIFGSVFWGAIVTSFFVCAISFLLNITWILTRKSILWWIQRAERLSRVRKMVEALEKYRTRQMDSLHEKYTKRVQGVRDNYHQQVEALRVSYSQTSEKFRGYGAAQMDAVSAQIENIRDNYNAQLGRVRDYGSKRADQLWESYERQVNRMRTFSLQQRLKLMRQYKVKQRYLNKLLESFQADSPEELRQHEEEVRAALELPVPPNITEVGDDDDLRRLRLSRASSFHSLPEYIIDKNGEIRQTPLTPAPNGQIDFEELKRKSIKSPMSQDGIRDRAKTTSPDEAVVNFVQEAPTQESDRGSKERDTPNC